MYTQQAYINGFIKRANEYGYTDNQAIELLKLGEYQNVDYPGGYINAANIYKDILLNKKNLIELKH